VPTACLLQRQLYPLLPPIEVLDDEGNFLRIGGYVLQAHHQAAPVVITSVDTASEALSVSLSEKAKVDMIIWAELTGKTEQEIFEDLQGVIFLNPMHTLGRRQSGEIPARGRISLRECPGEASMGKSQRRAVPAGLRRNVQALE
jgi:hypothetical protein